MIKHNDGRPSLLVFKKGSVSRYDKAQARKAGFVVLESDNPENVRLLEPSQQIQSSDLFWAAIKAIDDSLDSTSNRYFVENVAMLAERARREGESNE